MSTLSKIHYTSDDVLVLRDMCIDFISVRGISFRGGVYATMSYVTHSVVKIPYNTEYKDYTIKLYKILKTHASQTFKGSPSKIRAFIYTVDFNDVPLYINDPELNLFVQWRLKIGK